MAFCTKCGIPVEGDFCTKCGTKLGSPGESSTQIPQTGPAVTKKRSPLLWILCGCLGLIVIGGIILTLTGIFVARKAGLDPELARKNPQLAAAKMIANLNPDVEVLSVDEDRGTLELRDKKTGKTVIMNMDEVQEGRIVFTDDENRQIELQTRREGDDAEMEIQSQNGSILMGSSAAARLPVWLPTYPGALDDGSFGMSMEEGRGGSCAFKTDDSVETVAEFYENALKRAGFKVDKNVNRISGQGSMIILTATDDNSQRSAQVMATNEDKETTISLTFREKE